MGFWTFLFCFIGYPKDLYSFIVFSSQNSYVSGVCNMEIQIEDLIENIREILEEVENGEIYYIYNGDNVACVLAPNDFYEPLNQ
jgi:hypothetical protein